MDPQDQQQGVISLAQLRANPKLHSEADEQTQIRIEKGIAKEQLQTYFSSPGRRIVLDNDTPTIFCQRIDPVTKTLNWYTIPTTNVTLHRVEMTDVQPGPGSSAVPGNIHSLRLYVHAGEPCTAELLAKSLETIVRKTDEDGRFFRQGAGWALLQWGLQIMFFEYSGGNFRPIGLEDIPKEIPGVNSPEIAPMD